MSNGTLLTIDEDFILSLTSRSPEYNKIKTLFENVVHDKAQRHYVIFLALLNQRINSILSHLTQIEEVESTSVRKILNKKDDVDSLVENIGSLNSEFKKALDELKSIGKDLLESSYYKDTLKTYLKDTDSKYLSARIYNKYGTPMPKRMTPFSDGYDVFLPTEVILLPNTPVIVDTGLIIEPPSGFHIEIQVRSSLAKAGVTMPTGVGIIDSDYCGKEDFIKFIFLYLGNRESVVLQAGMRVAQLRFIKNTPSVEFIPISLSEIDKPIRGGLGSTK